MGWSGEIPNPWIRSPFDPIRPNFPVAAISGTRKVWAFFEEKLLQQKGLAWGWGKFGIFFLSKNWEGFFFSKKNSQGKKWIKKNWCVCYFLGGFKDSRCSCKLCMCRFFLPVGLLSFFCFEKFEKSPRDQVRGKGSVGERKERHNAWCRECTESGCRDRHWKNGAHHEGSPTKFSWFTFDMTGVIKYGGIESRAHVLVVLRNSPPHKKNVRVGVIYDGACMYDILS